MSDKLAIILLAAFSLLKPVTMPLKVRRQKCVNLQKVYGAYFMVA